MSDGSLTLTYESSGLIESHHLFPSVVTTEDVSRVFGQLSPVFKMEMETVAKTTLFAVPMRPETSPLLKPQAISPADDDAQRSKLAEEANKKLETREAELYAKIDKLLNSGPDVDFQDVTEFTKGVLEGFIDGVKNGLGGMAVDGVILAGKGLAYVGQQSVSGVYHGLQLAPGIREVGSYFMGYDIGADEERALTRMAVRGAINTVRVVQWTQEQIEFAQEVYDEVQKLLARGSGMLFATMLTGSSDQLDEIIDSIEARTSTVAREALQVARMALVEIGHAIVDVDSKTLGYIVGAVAYEAVESAVVSALIGAMGVGEVATVGAATPVVAPGAAGLVGARAASFARFLHRISKADIAKRFPVIIKSLERLQDVAVMAIRYPMCFVAGTKVHTFDGLKNIEQIEIGELVLCRDEHNADAPNTYQPVTEVFRTNPNRLLTIRVTSNEDDSTDELTCTGQHPFYAIRGGQRPSQTNAQRLSVLGSDDESVAVLDSRTGAFVPADELDVGDQLLLANGSMATIASIEQSFAGDSEPFTTYNFAVEGEHTYFVGELGIWVHNTGNPCDEAFETFVEMVKAGKGQTEAYVESLKKLLKKGDEGKALIRKHVADLSGYVTEAFEFVLKKDYPDAPDELVNLVARKKYIRDEDIGDFFGSDFDSDELEDLLDNEIVGFRNRKGARSKPGSIQEHHIIPDEVRAQAKAAGIEIDDFTIGMDYESHVGSKVGVHHMFAADEIDPVTGIVKKSAFEKKYNKAWTDFFETEEGDPIERSPKEILDFAQDMIERYGIDGV